MLFEKLFTVDSKGKTRFWMMEQDGSRFRTISGLIDGKAVESEWTQCFAKNVGRSNATTAEEQATAEIKSQYQKKLDKKYYTEADFDKSETKGYKFTGPMLAVKYEKFPGPCYSQPKLDGCISGDSIVITENGEKMVKDVYNGDDGFIQSYDIKTNSIRMSKILGKYKNAIDIKHHKKKWLKIQIFDNSYIKVTEDHRFYLPDLKVWRKAKDLKIGDVLLNSV
jgi:hypothetical protein